MPVSYPIPPWIHGVSPGEIGQLTLEASKANAQIQEQQQRLQQESAQASQKLAAQQEAEQQDTLREQQRLNIEKAYKDAEIGLRKQQLDQSKQQLAAQTQMAARKFQAQQQAQQRIQAGEDPSKVWMELGPQLGMNGPAMAALAKKPFQFGGATGVPGLPDDYKAVQTGPESRRIMHIPSTATGSEIGSPIPVVGPNGEKLGFRIPMPNGKQVLRSPQKESYADLIQQQIADRIAAKSGASSPTKSALPKAIAPSREKLGPNEQVFLVKGRKAVYNVKNKAFVRWLDAAKEPAPAEAATAEPDNAD